MHVELCFEDIIQRYTIGESNFYPSLTSCDGDKLIAIKETVFNYGMK